MIATLALVILLAQETRKFPVQGTDLMNGAEVTGTTKVGQNIRLDNSSKMVISPLPEKMQFGSYQVKVHVLPLSAGATFDFRKKVDGKMMSWPIELAEGKWRVKTGDGNEFTVPATLGQWTDVIFEVIDESKTEKGVTQEQRTLKITVDGKPILNGGRHTGQLTDFTFTTNNKGIVVIGGVDLLQSTKIKR